MDEMDDSYRRGINNHPDFMPRSMQAKKKEEESKDGKELWILCIRLFSEAVHCEPYTLLQVQLTQPFRESLFVPER